jgi:hypothetical protein
MNSADKELLEKAAKDTGDGKNYKTTKAKLKEITKYRGWD